MKKLFDRHQVYTYYLFVFLRNLSFFSAVLVPFFTQWAGLSQFHVQLIQSWFMLWFFILEVPTGVIADKLGRKNALVAGSVLVAVAALVYGSMPSIWVFLLGEFLFALANSLISGADQAWLYETLEVQDETHKTNSIFGQAGSFQFGGMLVAGVVGGVLANKLGLNAPMLLSAVPFVLAAGVALCLKENQSSRLPAQQLGYFALAKHGLEYLFHHQVLLRFAIDSTIIATTAYFALWLYQPLLSHLGVPIVYFGDVQAGLLLVEIIVLRYFTVFERVLARTQLGSYQKVTAVLTAVGFLVAAVWPSFLSAAMLIVLAGGFGLTRRTYIEAQMNTHIPSEKRATVLSAISMLGRFALVIANPVIGLMADKSLMLAFVVLGVGSLSVLFITEPHKGKLKTT